MDQTLRQIAEQTAGQWLDYREGDAKSDRVMGRKAASADIALLVRRHADFQDGLLARAKAASLALRDRLGAHRADLRRQVEELSRECDEDIGERLREGREQRQQAMRDLERSLGRESAAQRRAEERLAEAEKALRSIRAEVAGRPLRRGFVRVYIPLLLLLAVVEVPVNRLAFELFFQERPAISTVLALAVGLTLMFFAHVVGTLLRRSEMRQRFAAHVRRGAAIVFLLLLVATLMVALASMRQLYIHFLEAQQQGGSLQDQVDQLVRGGATNAIASVATAGLGTAGWTLLILNVVLFILGVAAAFFRHDPHPDYESAWTARERARRTLTRLQARHERALATRLREFDQRLVALDSLMRETQAKRDELAAREAAVDPFFRDTTARIANLVRGRSLSWLEGAVAAIPAGAGVGAMAELRAISEQDAVRHIGSDGIG